MRIKGLFKRDPAATAAQALYAQVVEQARLPGFYRDLGVPDTLDGRFDMIVLHAFLVLHRLKAEGQAQGPVGQALFDLMFADMDQNLREMGVGDLAVGKRIKAMAKGFYGRLAAYDKALSEGDATAMAAAVRRNVYRNIEPQEAQVAAMAAYLQREAERLDASALALLQAGELSFGAPPEQPAARLPA